MVETTDFITLTGGANLLVLASAAGEETLCCGTLIAEACARGRPPFVAILTDVEADAGARQASLCLGVPPDWVLLLGQPGAVEAVAMLMWRYDCNVIVAPAADSAHAGQRACHDIARRVASASGVGLLTYRTSGAPRLTLRAPRGAARRQAALAHLSQSAHIESYEVVAA